MTRWVGVTSSAPAPRLSAGFRQLPLWQAELPAFPVSAGPPPRSCDVLVVGGGYAGLRAATVLARAGREVAVVTESLFEAASGRNGGQVLAELHTSHAVLKRRHGGLGQAAGRETAEYLAAFETMVAELGDEADVQYRRCGHLMVAHNPAAAARMAGYAEDLQAVGEHAELLSPERLADELDSPLAHAGVLVEAAGAVHPGRLHLALARQAVDAGVRMHDGHRVHHLEPHDGAVVAHLATSTTSEGGTIRAGSVVLATHATAHNPWAPARSRVLAINSYMVATEPLDASLVDAIARHRRTYVDTKQLLFYWQVTADGRLAFGGRKSLRPATLEQSTAFLAAAVDALFPQLAEARTGIEFAWFGQVAMTLNRLPVLRRDGQVVTVAGCNGSGVALMSWLGGKAGELLLGGEAPALGRLPQPLVPVRPLAPLGLPLLSRWVEHQDRPWPSPVDRPHA